MELAQRNPRLAAAANPQRIRATPLLWLEGSPARRRSGKAAPQPRRGAGQESPCAQCQRMGRSLPLRDGDGDGDGVARLGRHCLTAAPLSSRLPASAPGPVSPQ